MKPVADTPRFILCNGVEVKYNLLLSIPDGVGQDLCCWLWSFQMC